MRIRFAISILLVALLLLAACSRGPSNKEAAELVSAVYLTQAEIVKKSRCEVTPELESKGHTNLWLIRYRLEGARHEATMTLTKMDGEWQIYAGPPVTCR